MPGPEALRGDLGLPSGARVSTLLLRPPEPRALLVLAHGAGAGMEHAFMQGVARGLLERGVATWRYAFPYMEGRGWPPDRPPVLVETVRAAVDTAVAALPGVPAWAGGKSLGGRMTSTAAAEHGLPGIRGLCFLGFPLHTRKNPGTSRGRHLARVGLPTLFVQGTRDELADLDLLRCVLAEVEPRPTLHEVEGADHGFHVLKRSGRTDEEVLEEVCDAVAGWMAEESGGS